MKLLSLVLDQSESTIQV